MWPQLGNIFGLLFTATASCLYWVENFYPSLAKKDLSFAHIYHGWISSFIFVVSPEQNVSFEQKSKSQTKIMTLQAKVAAF